MYCPKRYTDVQEVKYLQSSYSKWLSLVGCVSSWRKGWAKNRLLVGDSSAVLAGNMVTSRSDSGRKASWIWHPSMDGHDAGADSTEADEQQT